MLLVLSFLERKRRERGRREGDGGAVMDMAGERSIQFLKERYLFLSMISMMPNNS